MKYKVSNTTSTPQDEFDDWFKSEREPYLEDNDDECEYEDMDDHDDE